MPLAPFANMPAHFAMYARQAKFDHHSGVSLKVLLRVTLLSRLILNVIVAVV